MELVQALFQAAESMPWWGWLLSIGTVIWGVGKRFLPGWGAAIGDGLFNLWAPKEAKQTDRLTYAISGGAIKVLELAQEVPAVREYLEEHLDEDDVLDVHAALKELRDAKKAQGAE